MAGAEQGGESGFVNCQALTLRHALTGGQTDLSPAPAGRTADDLAGARSVSAAAPGGGGGVFQATAGIAPEPELTQFAGEAFAAVVGMMDDPVLEPSEVAWADGTALQEEG
jgi:hypothetical protein